MTREATFTDDRLEISFGGVPAFVISRHHLITNKKTTARLQDLADVQQLEAIEDGFQHSQ
jgi:hypothetical protein